MFNATDMNIILADIQRNNNHRMKSILAEEEKENKEEDILNKKVTLDEAEEIIKTILSADNSSIVGKTISDFDTKLLDDLSVKIQNEINNCRKNSILYGKYVGQYKKILEKLKQIPNLDDEDKYLLQSYIDTLSSLEGAINGTKKYNEKSGGIFLKILKYICCLGGTGGLCKFLLLLLPQLGFGTTLTIGSIIGIITGTLFYATKLGKKKIKEIKEDNQKIIDIEKDQNLTREEKNKREMEIIKERIKSDKQQKEKEKEEYLKTIKNSQGKTTGASHFGTNIKRTGTSHW